MLRVLIVEDDARVARVNRSFIERVDEFEVAGVAATAAQAERALQELGPDVVILDLYLPDGSGLDLLRRLRSAGRPADVIVVTAAQDAPTVQACLRGGAVDYIVKPYRFERFADTLGRYRAYRQQLAAARQVGQAQVDRLFAAAYSAPRLGAGAPKGIDPLTLERVEQVLAATAEPLTAEAFGHKSGLSRTTARRYLEYLVRLGRAWVEPVYGDVGRPERRYSRLP